MRGTAYVDLGMSFKNRGVLRQIWPTLTTYEASTRFNDRWAKFMNLRSLQLNWRHLIKCSNLAALSVDEVLNSSTVKIDFSLAPGPTQFWEVQHKR